MFAPFRALQLNSIRYSDLLGFTARRHAITLCIQKNDL